MALLHMFLAYPPDPMPRGWQRWRADMECRASCACGWLADSNSPNHRSASDRWASEHRNRIEVRDDNR